MSTVRSAGDRMLFREDFWNATMVERNDGLEVGAPVISDGLSGGQVAWYGKAHTYAFDRDLSIVVECIAVTSGSNQALLSIGTLAARRIEFGIDALGQPYAWGTAQVNLGLPVDDGPHVFAFSVNTYGNVTCVVDGVLWGTGTVVFGPLTTRMLAGGSCVGGLDWGATVRPIRIYGYAADYATLVSLCGLPASSVWTPDLMLVGRDGLYEDLDADGAVTLNTQPNLIDGDMEAAGTAAWIPGGTAVLSKQGLAYTGLQCLRNSGVHLDSASQAVLPGFVVGNIYISKIALRCDGIMYAQIRDLGGGMLVQSFSNVWDRKVYESVCNFTTIQLRIMSLTPPGGGYVEFDDWDSRNLSISGLTCKGNKGNLAQATPASMTWSSDPQAPTSTPRNGRRLNYSDGVADHNVSTLAAAGWPLHQAAGFTYCEVITVAAAAAANDTLIDSCNRSALSHGINANYDVTNKKLVVSVANGSGTFVVSEGMTVAPGKTITVDATWTAVDGLEVSVNGAPPMVQPTPPADKAVRFDGVNQAVNMGDVLGLEWNQPFSISALVRPVTRDKMILAKCTSGTLYGYFLQFNGVGGFGFELRSNVSRLAVGCVGQALDDGNIHHLIAAYDGSGTYAGVDLYIDGSPVYVKGGLDTFAPASIINASNFYLGTLTAITHYFSGQQGDITVFNKKLTALDVTEIYNDGRPVDMLATSLAPNLLAWWKMGEGDVFPTIRDARHGVAPSALYPTILDLSGSGFHGTMTNMATNDIVLDSPGGTFSKMSLDFDGVNDFVNMGDVLNFDYNSRYTYSAWFKSTAVGGYIISKKDGTPHFLGWGAAFEGGTGGRLGIWHTHSEVTANLRLRTVNTYNDGNWHHLCVTLDGSGTCAGTTVYVDNVPVATTIITDTLGTNTTVNSISLNVGARTGGAATLIGKVTDPAVWNETLTPAQVTEVHNGGIPTDNRLLSSAPNLVGYWRMGDDVRFDGTMVNMAASNIVDMGPSAVAASATLQDGRTSGNADFFQGSRADKIVLVGKATAGELANWRRYTAAKYGIDTRAKACQFLGGTRHTRHGNVLGYERTNQFSVGFWIKLTGNTGYVCAKADANRGWGIGNDNGQMLFSLYAPGAELRVRSTTDLRAAGWHFVTFAYDGSALAAGVTFYLDGVASGSTVISDTIGANTLINAAEFNVGGRTNGSVILDNAVLDEVSVWAKTLTPAEVVEIHNAALPINLRTTTCKAALAAWWRMGDSDTHPTLLDSGGFSAFNGTMTNMLATDIIDRI